MAPPLRLLLVEDAPEIARVVQHLARRAGQEVVCRGDVPAAWEYLHAEGVPRPDLLLLDVNLPGASGLDLFRRLQQEGGRFASLPVALFVSWSVSDSIAEGLAEGIDFVVSKDLLARPEGWKERVEEVLDLAAHPPLWGLQITDCRLQNEKSHSGLDPQSAICNLQSLIAALRHPSLRRLGDDVVRALWARSLRRALAATGEPPVATGELPAAEDIDIWGSAAKLIQTLASLIVDRPTFPTALALALSYQAACLLGEGASEPLRTALSRLVSQG